MRNNSSTKGYYVYCTYYTRKDGTRVYAKDYGLKAWRFWVGR